MYTVRHLPPTRHTDARGLTLDEAFVRMMALSERQYRFVRTGWGTQLLMSNSQPSDPIFYVDMNFSAEARQEIKRMVCAHGLGLFHVMTEMTMCAWLLATARRRDMRRRGRTILMGALAPRPHHGGGPEEYPCEKPLVISEIPKRWWRYTQIGDN